jgi:hypothetical protein
MHLPIIYIEKQNTCIKKYIILIFVSYNVPLSIMMTMYLWVDTVKEQFLWEKLLNGTQIPKFTYMEDEHNLSFHLTFTC